MMLSKENRAENRSVAIRDQWLMWQTLDADRVLVLRRWYGAAKYVTHVWSRQTDSYEYGRYIHEDDQALAEQALVDRVKEMR